MAGLTEEQRDRYSRQLMIDLIDDEHQESLLDASVLVVGAGGLGSPVIQYLAGSGVGHLGILDSGDVKRSNLHRQVIHAAAAIGESKAESAAKYVKRRNDDVRVEAVRERLREENAKSLVEGYDVVVDGLDGFEARYLLNEVTQKRGVPFVHGAVYGFVGQMMVFTSVGPCYRCLYPEQPEDIPSDEAMGIFPPVPGIIGCLQASEALKCILDIGEIRDDRLLRFQALETEWFESPVTADPDCPVCCVN